MKVPTLNVAGWWDQRDFYGPLRIYEALEKCRLGGHELPGCGSLKLTEDGERDNGSSLGPVPFDSSTSRYLSDEVPAPWFAYFLKDKGRLHLPEALTFEAGSNRWQRWDSWPPRSRVERREESLLQLGWAQTNKPLRGGQKAAFDSYLSDPTHPVPYRHRPIQATYFHGRSLLAGMAGARKDQRFVDDRADVLSWESVPLEQ